MMKTLVAATLANALAAFAAPPVLAQPQPDPDWPCIQAKVPELSAVAIWSGPPLEDAQSHWREDTDVAAAAGEVASRRTPIEDATVSVSEFARGLSPEEKSRKLTLLFAGIFETLDRERSEVMDGIDRYARAQKSLAERIRAEQTRLSDLNSSNGDPQQASVLTNDLMTQVRVFNERGHSLTYVCEVPTLIEQRLGTLARAIQAEIQK
jgi:hypothetical protein